MPKGSSHYTTGTLSEHRLRNILSGISVEIKGDWVKARLILEALPTVTKAAALKAQLDFAKKYQAQLRQNIKENGSSIGWVPLSKDYIRWKNKKDAPFGGSDMYRFYGTYYNSIEIIQKGHNVSIGISKSKDKISPHSKLRVSQYALILEMGSYSRNIPARKLWGPSFKQIGGRAALLKSMHINLNMAVKGYGIILS